MSDMMTLDKAIKRQEELTKHYENRVNNWQRCTGETEYISTCMDIDVKKAEEHKQLAEWLKELKVRRGETEPKIIEALLQDDSVSRRYLLAEIDDLADEFSEIDENGLHSERWCGILDSRGIIVNAPPVSQMDSL